MVKRYHPAKPICSYSPKAAARGLETYGVARRGYGYIPRRCLFVPSRTRAATACEVAVFWCCVALSFGLSWWVLM